MLQTIRERAQGWIAWAIVILISIPFALWGIQSYLGVGSEPVIATVNGIDITERELDYRYRDVRARLREQLGAAYRPELFDDKKMRAEVLDQMIQENVLLYASEDLGLRASNQELQTAIVSNPAFQREGHFDNATYERMLELQGTRPVQYEDSLRRRIVGTQLARAIVASELVTDKELAENVQLGRQQRRVSSVSIPKARFETDEPTAEEEVQAYYEANQPVFQTPERVKVQYLVLDAESIDAAESPGEEELRALYESENERFRQPERRRVRHILVTLDADADSATEEAAKASIEELRARLEAGEDFGELAKTVSQDPGSSGQGGDLGLIEPGLMDPAFDEAAFALELNALSDPVRSQFGYHLLQVTEVEEGVVKSFEEVRDQLMAEATKRGAEGLFFDWAERLANLSYESPDSLEPAAEALGLELKTSDWFDRSGGEGFLANRKVVAAVFSDEVLKEGNNTDLIEPEPKVLEAIVLRVFEHEEASAQPLDEVRDQILTALRQKRATEAAEAAAAELAEHLISGAELTEAAGDYEVKEYGLVMRGDAQAPAGVLEAAFTLARPQEGGASYGSRSLQSGDAAVVAVTEVVDGAAESLDEGTRAQERRGLAQMIGRTYYDDLLADLKSRADIERKPLGEAFAE
ncbi:MAG: SurA N-terminal domain-containing protein [Pseudomonadota bacterium]|nr:SurA N-terminal domain-containing protein [Pseudomonadota bacterium]